MKEHIIKEATNMFVQYGVKAIRMDDIATNLGISKRTIYEIFGDKENLIMECMTYYHDQVHPQRYGMGGNDTNIIEEFIHMLDDWEDNTETNHKIMMSIRRFYPKVYERLREKFTDDGYEKLRQKLQKGVEEGYMVSNVNYDLAVAIFSYSIFGLISNQKSILPHNVSEKEAFKYVVTYFFRGIATEKGRKMIDEYINKQVI